MSIGSGRSVQERGEASSVSVCSGEELQSWWPKVRAGRTVAVKGLVKW